MRKKKDKRAIKLMKTNIFRRLELNVRSGLNARKAFIRWDTFSRQSLVQYCAEKIPINSRINHMIALYRLLRVARQTKVKIRKYEEHTEFFETVIRQYNSLNDKYNSVANLTEASFGRIKDHYIRCSKLIALDSITRKILTRHSFASESMVRFKEVISIKTRLFYTLRNSSNIRVSEAFQKLIKQHSSFK